MNRTCPTHGTRLYGGPIRFICLHGKGHGVAEADLPREFRATQAEVDAFDAEVAAYVKEMGDRLIAFITAPDDESTSGGGRR